MNVRMSPNVSSRPSFDTGFSTNATAPARSAFCRPSPPETMCTGMWRVSGCCFNRSRTPQPSITGSVMSRIVFDDQHDAVALLDVVAVVAHVARQKERRIELALLGRRGRRAAVSFADG